MGMMHYSALVIERDRALRQTLCDLLTLKGYTADAVATGKDGLTHLLNATYHFVLLDIEVVDYDGLDLLRTIHRLCPQVVIIVLTACSDLNMARQARELDTAVYLIKPVDPNVLLQHISQQISPHDPSPLLLV